MRRTEEWRPSKLAVVDGRWGSSRDVASLAVGSRLVTQLVADVLCPAVATHAHGMVFDLGCGRVPLYEVYAPRSTTIVCADWPGSRHDVQHADLWCDVGRGLPFGDDVADTVISSDVLEHLPEPSTVFAEFARVLAPGGVLVLNTPFLYRVHEAPDDYLRHTAYSLRRHAETAGLVVEELEPVGGVLDVLADLVAKVLAEVPWVGRPLSAWFQTIALAVSGSAWGRRVRRHTRHDFPLAHVLVARRPHAVTSVEAQ